MCVMGWGRGSRGWQTSSWQLMIRKSGLRKIHTVSAKVLSTLDILIYKYIKPVELCFIHSSSLWDYFIIILDSSKFLTTVKCRRNMEGVVIEYHLKLPTVVSMFVRNTTYLHYARCNTIVYETMYNKLMLFQQLMLHCNTNTSERRWTQNIQSRWAGYWGGQRGDHETEAREQLGATEHSQSPSLKYRSIIPN